MIWRAILMAHPFISATLATFQHELRLLLRDPFCVALLICFCGGLAWASGTSQFQWRAFAIQQTERQAAAREAWLSQSTENAHMATHHGQTVYKPVSPLTGFDPGSVSEFGSTLFLQSHHQSTATNPPRRDSVDLNQNEAYSPAVLLALMGPLLIIILGIASVAREKEGGTLSILLTTGAPWPAIMLGKSLTILLILWVVALPAFWLFAVPWFETQPLVSAVDLMVRELLILLTLVGYFVGWIGLTLAVSAKSESSIGSFSVLIALWSTLVLIVPRIAGDTATYVSPLPTKAEIRLEKESAVQKANQSSVERTRLNQALEARLLKEFQVDRIEDLPIDLAGAQMIDQEFNTNRIFDKIDERVSQATERQNEILQQFQFTSPYLAIRAVSSSLSATDRSHHIDFLNTAEQHRRQFVNELNTAEMKRTSPGNSAEERREFWAQVSAFQPNFASSFEAIKRSLSALICVFIWAITMGTAAFLTPPQFSRVS